MAEDAPRTPTLAEYAVGLKQVQIDVSRQSNRFTNLKEIVRKLESGEAEGLPILGIRMPPVDGDTPDYVEFDLATAAEPIRQMITPLFAAMRDNVADDCLSAWENLDGINTKTKPMVGKARAAMAAQNTQGSPPAVAPQ